MTSHLRINTNIDNDGNITAPLSPWIDMDTKTPSSASSSPRNQEEAVLAFEMASLRLDEIMTKHKQAKKPTENTIDLRPEKWSKQAPGTEYKGKRTNKGMPDKRTKAGKEWYASVIV